MTSKALLDSMSKYDNYSFKDDVIERLQKTLKAYLRELDQTSERILRKTRKDIVVKELSK